MVLPESGGERFDQTRKSPPKPKPGPNRARFGPESGPKMVSKHDLPKMVNFGIAARRGQARVRKAIAKKQIETEASALGFKRVTLAILKT